MDDKTPETDNREFTVLDTQAVKGVAILLMMWHHLFGFPAYHSYQTLLPVNFAYYLGLFGKICVAIYLFLSGYGLTKSAGKQTGPLGRRIAQRLRQFYAGYWLYFAICVPYGLFVLGGLRDDGGGGDWRRLLLNLSGFITVNNAYDIAWWFVGVYVVFLALFPLLYRIGRADPLLLVMIALAGMGVQTRVWAGGIPGAILLWQAPFLIGIVAAQNRWLEGSVAQRMAAKPWWWHFAALLALFLFRFRAEGDCTYDFIIAPLLVYSSACLIRKSNLGKPLSFLGELSLPLWLTHGFLAYAYAEHWIYSPRYPLLIFALLLLLNVPAVWLVERFRRWGEGIVLGRRIAQVGR